MGKKQTRQNRGARTGGHERSATAATGEPSKTPTSPETEQPVSKHIAHRRERKFGHN